MTENLISLQPYGITRTEKVLWRIPYKGGDILTYFKSKSMRSFLRDVETVLQKNQITWELKPLTKAEFTDWLAYYNEKMKENDFDILANEAWFDSRTAMGRHINGLFFFKAEKMIGSGIISLEGTTKATLAFKASDRLDLTNRANASLGSIIEYFYLKLMSEAGVSILSGGRSRNAFGVINTLGYLDYKLRFGYEPAPVLTNGELDTVPINQEGHVLFYGLRSAKLHLFALVPVGSDITFEQARFNTPELPFETIYY